MLFRSSLNRLRRVLKSQLDDELPAYGRNPYRDPNLPDVTDQDTADVTVSGTES